MITHDRYLRIKEILHSAEAKEPAERLDFLDEVCGNDQLLREQVEAFLAAYESDDGFLAAPAYEFVGGLLADEPNETAEFVDGQNVGLYTIERLLGTGGMGQIYLAQDQRLGRKVALKFIAREFATDPRRVLRFEQEARAVSSLNHPNVCIIHEIGVTETGRHFIAMEYIEGTTLREKLRGGTLTSLEAVNIASQIAAALASAHAAGIVHRDIKPENIMLPPHGFAKVLDFGLAKLTERVPQRPHLPSGNVHTEAGMLMGTVKYMSPEQLRQAVLDDRTDIWSLGIVLYEMLTGTTPFEAPTSNDSIALILGPQTPPLTFPNDLHPELAGIIRKAIEKDRAERYQNVKQFEADLNALQRELEQQITDGIPSPRPQPVPWYHSASEYMTQQTAGSAIFRRLTSQALSTAEVLLTEIRAHKTAAVFTGAFGVLLLLLFIPGAARFVSNLFENNAQQQSFAIKPFTNTNRALLAAISPDGKLVAHVEDMFGQQRVVIAPTDTPGAEREVIAPETAKYLGITFSRDNNYLYVTREAQNGPGILYRVPQTGGPIARVKEGVESPISLSPRGDQFTYVRYDKEKKEYSVMVAGIDGGNERVLATRKRGATFSTFGLSWSPDGNTIVGAAGRWNHGFHLDLIGIDVNTGEERKIGEKDWSSVYQVAWQDADGLIICARKQDISPHQLWRINLTDGSSQNLTNNVDDYKGVSVAGNQIVTVRTGRSWEISVATPESLTPAAQIASGNGFSYGVSWSSNGTMVYSAMTDERLDIWRLDPETRNRVQLTNTGINYSPVLSPDGRFVVFSSKRDDGRVNIWRMNATDGSGLQQLTFSDANYYPSISPDNQWVAYDNLLDEKVSIWKVPLYGGDAVKVAAGYRMPVFSPDSSRIAGRYHTSSGTEGVAIFPAAGGEALQHLRDIPGVEWQRVQWINDHTLSYIGSRNGVYNLWSYDVHTQAKKQLTFFDSDQIVSYAWSSDFKQVACQRVTNTNDVTIHSSER